MTTVHFRRAVSIDADRAWQRLAALDRVHELVSFLDDAVVRGDRRECRIAAGGPAEGSLHEVILGVDPELRRVAYTIVESPFGFEQHAASMSIEEDARGVWFVWITDVKPDGVAEMMADTFKREADHIADRLST